MKAVRWTTRILAVSMLLFGLPFYFGYGNPLPFVNPDFTPYDNVWLTIFPFIFIGLGLGIWREKLGGYLIVIPMLVGIFTSMVMGMGFGLHMLAPLAVGFLYLMLGYRS